MKEKKYPELTPELALWFIIFTWLMVLFNLVAVL